MDDKRVKAWQVYLSGMKREAVEQTRDRWVRALARYTSRYALDSLGHAICAADEILGGKTCEVWTPDSPYGIIPETVNDDREINNVPGRYRER